MASKPATLTPPVDDQGDKLLNLYWNRAELKKAFAESQKEQRRLQSLIDEREGAAERFRQKLGHLENLLADPAWVHSVVTHYQLRALNTRCKNRVARFSEQLKQQREKRQRATTLEAWKSGIDKEADAVSEQRAINNASLLTAEQQAVDLETSLETLGLFSRWFKGPGLRRALDGVNATIAELRQLEDELDRRLDEIAASELPDNTGLDRNAKRSINFMILAYLQELYIHFEDNGFASLVKEAGDKSVGAIAFGDKSECDELLEQVQACWTVFDAIADNIGALKERARRLSEKAIFMQDDDVVPVAATVAELIRVDGRGPTSSVNLLGENYWGVGEALSR